jgi:Pyruvate/2-oxoacid:ferredoxin oxidoreductase delta subunit
MALRNIVKIDEDKCTGCGQCVRACAEGAIAIVNGKARLVSEVYCDGLGACIGHCPEDAITIERRESAEFDEEATKAHLAQQKVAQLAFVCPGAAATSFSPRVGSALADAPSTGSQLSQWPVQLALVAPNAPYFANADLLLVADCVPFAMGDFHNRFLRGRSIAVGCPKLDDAEFYVDKLAMILKANKLAHLTVIHMEVPCCSGLTQVVRKALRRSGVVMPFEDVTISLQGDVIRTQKVECGPGF